MPETNPIRPTDPAARALAKDLIAHARHGVLATLDTTTGHPFTSRIGIATGPDGGLISLVSSLAHHSSCLKSDARCSVLLGDVSGKGDPLTHPRLTILANALFVDQSGPDHLGLRDTYLKSHPKSKLYIDFNDFSFIRFDIQVAHLNGGFGQAFHLTPEDLT